MLKTLDAMSLLEVVVLSSKEGVAVGVSSNLEVMLEEDVLGIVTRTLDSALRVTVDVSRFKEGISVEFLSSKKITESY